MMNGTALLFGARLHPDHQFSNGRWDDPPRWLRAVAGRGSGPLSIMNLSVAIYGLGMAIPGLGSGLFSTIPSSSTSCWPTGFSAA